MMDHEHSMTQAEIDAVEHRLRNLSLRVLPQLVERDLPRLLNEVRSLHAILFMNTFTTSLQNGVDANETGTETETNLDEGTNQEGTRDSQDGGGDRPSGEGSSSESDAGVQDSSGKRINRRVRASRTTNKKRNKKRRRRNK